MKLTTTLARIKANSPCEDGLEPFLKHLGSDYPEDKEIDLLTILESNGIEDFFWAFRTVEDKELAKRVAVELATKFAERVLPIFEKKYPNDPRPREAIQTVKAWLKGNKAVDLSKSREAAFAARVAAFEKGFFMYSKAAEATELAVLIPACIEKLGSGWSMQSIAHTVIRVADAAAWAVGEAIESEAFKAERQAQIEIIKELLA